MIWQKKKINDIIDNNWSDESEIAHTCKWRLSENQQSYEYVDIRLGNCLKRPSNDRKQHPRGAKRWRWRRYQSSDEVERDIEKGLAEDRGWSVPQI